MRLKYPTTILVTTAHLETGCNKTKPTGTRAIFESLWLNTLRPRPNGHDFADGVLKFIFVYEKGCISIQMSPKFVLHSPINNTPVLVDIMDWCLLGTTPFSEMIVVKCTDAYICHSALMILPKTNCKHTGTDMTRNMPYKFMVHVWLWYTSEYVIDSHTYVNVSQPRVELLRLEAKFIYRSA